MANVPLSNLRVPAVTGIKAAGDTNDLQTHPWGLLGNPGSNSRQFQSVHAPPDSRTGENFTQLKLTAEKMMQEEAGLRSELNILKTKYLQSEEDVRNLESKVADLNNEIAMLTVEHNEDVKLWKGLDSKFLATTTFSNHLTQTLTILESQLQEAEQSKCALEGKLAERETFFQDTKYQIDETSRKLEGLQESVIEYEATVAKLSAMIQQQTATLAAEVARSKKLSSENDDLQEQICEAVRQKEEDKKVIESKAAEIQLLTKTLLSKAEDVASLQSTNLSLVHAKGELEFHLKDVENSLKLEQKDNGSLREKVDMLNLRISELQMTNDAATRSIENLNSERAGRAERAEEERREHQNKMNELTHKLSEYEKYRESTRQTLLEKSQEIETLIRRVAERDSELQTTKDQVIRMQQECNEKQQRIEQLSEQEQHVQRQMQELRATCTAAEAAAKELSVRFKHQLEAKQAELTAHLLEISQRNNQEMADMRRRYEEQTKEAAAEEKRKGEAALEVIRQTSRKELSKELDTANRRLSCALKDHQDTVKLLKKASEEEKEKMLLQHAKDIRTKEQELRAEMEKRCSEAAQTLQQRIEELKKVQHAEMANLQTNHDILLKRAQETDSVKEQLRKVKEDHKAELASVIQQLNEKSHAMKRVHEADLLRLQRTASKDVEEWKSQAAYWQMEYSKLRAISSAKAAATEKKGAETDDESAPNKTHVSTTQEEPTSPAKNQPKSRSGYGREEHPNSTTCKTLSPDSNSLKKDPELKASKLASAEKSKNNELMLPSSSKADHLLPQDGLERVVTIVDSLNKEDHKLNLDEEGKDSLDKDELTRNSLTRLEELNCQKREVQLDLAPNNHSEQMQRADACQKVVFSIVPSRNQSAKMQSYPERVVGSQNSHGKGITCTRKQSRRSEMVEDSPSARLDPEEMGTTPMRSKAVTRASNQDCDKMKNVESWLQTSVDKSRRKAKKMKFNESQQQTKAFSKTLCDLFEMEELMDPYAFNES